MSSTIDTNTMASTASNVLKESASAAANRRSAADYSADKLDFESYMNLMVSQLKNQTMYDSADTSEMTQQMAQYSLVSAAEAIIQTQNTSYAASLIGKQVTAGYKTMTDDTTVTGVVTGVSIYDGQPLIYINGTAFNLDEISMVGTSSGETGSDRSEEQDSRIGEILEMASSAASSAAASAERAANAANSIAEALGMIEDSAAGGQTGSAGTGSGSEEETTTVYTADADGNTVMIVKDAVTGDIISRTVLTGDAADAIAAENASETGDSPETVNAVDTDISDDIAGNTEEAANAEDTADNISDAVNTENAADAEADETAENAEGSESSADISDDTSSELTGAESGTENG